MSKKIITSKKYPFVAGTYSLGVEFNNVIYFSGQIGLDLQSGELKENFEEQLEQILKNIDTLLKEVNLDRKNIIKTTVFLTNLNNFSLVNKAYQDYFTKPYPARSCVEVSKLPKDSQVEIEVIAAR